jgi:hypothetical protein
MKRISTNRSLLAYCVSLALLLLGHTFVQAQTILINPNGDGGFENGSTFAANGWTVANTPNSPYNAWWVGSAPAQFPTNAAYVSDDVAGATHTYSTTQGNQIHFYRDVTFPAGESTIDLSFDIVVQGENSWDMLQVSLVPTSVTPTGVASYPGSGFGPIIPGAEVLGTFVLLGTSVQSISISIPASLAGNCDAPATWRLVFSWKSDTSVGTQPPAAIDNISLTSATPSAMPLPSASPFTINNTLPTSGTNFNNFTDAINWLNGALACGPEPIVFNVSANQVFNEDPPEITATGDALNEIIFQKAGAGANPVIRKLSPGTIASTTIIGNNGDAIITIVGGDYITFDAIDLETDPTFSGVGLIEYGYYLKKASGTDACKNVTIKNCNITLNKTAVYSFGIFVSNISGTATVTVTSEGGRSENIKIFNNTISNAYGGIQLRGFIAPAPYNLYDQNIEIGEEGGNTITNFGGVATAVYGIYTIYQNNCKINNNTIQGGDGSTGVVYGIFMTTSNNGSYDVDDNNISLTSNSTTSLLVGIYSTIGTTGNTSNVVNIRGNTMTNFLRPSETSGATYFIYSTANAPFEFNILNNTMGSSSFPGNGAIYGIYNISTPPNMVVDGNTVSNITRGGTTSTALFYGISSTGSSTTHNTVISNNTIHSLTGNGSSGAVGGLNFLTVNNCVIVKNRIYNITSNNASAVVNGIAMTSVTNAQIYNNLISGLNAPSTGNSTAASPSVRGINISSAFAGSTRDIAFNTIVLDGSSTGANFGTAVIFQTFSAVETTSNMTLRSNILVNNSTPNGSGRAVVLQRSGVALNNYNTASNNNLFYAGTPGPSNLIYTDNTNADQTLSDFQCRVAPRESASVTENPPFLSLNGNNPNFLRINPAVPTRVESGGISVPGVNDDFDGDIRQGSPGYAGTGTAPDIGADEGEFIGLDVVGPQIAYTTLTNSVCLDPITLTADISDASGVNVAPGTAPRLWYKKSTEANVLPATNTSADSGWKWVEASNAVSPFNFTFNYTLLTSPVASGDIIQYFVVAQDLQATPNVGFNQVVFDNCGLPVSVALGASLFPASNTNSFNIINVPGAVEASAVPGELCISGDVSLSLSPANLGAEYQWESSPLGANMWTPIPGANSETFLVNNVSQSTDFRCVISCGGMPIGVSPSSIASVEVSSPEVLSTTPAEACGPGPVSVQLGATASMGAELNWYANATGGQAIGMGPLFNTPPLTTTTTFYVAASEGGSSESAAKPTYINTENTSGNQWGLVFNVVNTDVVIQTVDIYSVAASGGTISVELQSSTGAVLETAGPFPFPAGSTANPVLVTIPVNFSVPIGTGYRMVSAAMSGNLIREISGNTYPYTSPSGNVVVTNGFISGTSTTYYWFYNWQVSTGCETEREAVVATILNDEPECPQSFTVCSSANPFALSGATPLGGTYSGNGVSNGVFNPAAAGPGTHVITYTFCNSSCQFTITVGDPSADITVSENSGLFPNDGIICTGDSITLTVPAADMYSWSTGQTTQSITVAPSFSTTYVVTATDSFGCFAIDSVQVVVNALPSVLISPSSTGVCLGESTSLAASGALTYLWSTGATTDSITVSPVTNTTYFVTGTNVNNCSTQASSLVIVNAPPVITVDTLVQPTNCDSINGRITLFVVGTPPFTYVWSTTNGSGIVQGQQNQNALGVGTYTVVVTDFNACSSSTMITLVGPGNCDLCPEIGSLSVTPSVVCATDSFTVVASGLASMGVDYGITFKFSNTLLADPYTQGSSLGTVSNASLGNMGSTATFTQTLPAGSYYLYAVLSPAPTDPTCRPTVLDSLTVNPIPTVNSVASQVVCNSNTTTAVNFSGAVPGTVYSWTNNNTTIGLAANGTGNIPAFTAINNGTTPVVATITITPSFANGGVTCTGSPTSFTITVNPNPTVNQPANQVLCAGAQTQTVNFSGTVPNAVYNWTNNNTSVGLAASGSGNIPAFTAINNGTTPQVATITVTPSFSNGGVNCTGAPQTFTITVNPNPSVNQPANQVVCGGSLSQAVNFTGNIVNAVYNWTNNTPAIGLAAAGSGNIPAFTAVNNTGAPLVATITVTPSFTSTGVTCSGTPVAFTITVDPAATVNAGPDQTICQGQSANLNATLGGSATGGSWSGGAGTFSNPNSTNTSYTPAPAEAGTTVTLTFTTNDPAGPCTAASDALQLTINTPPLVFAGSNTKICPGDNLDLNSLGAFIQDNGSGVTTGTWSSSGSGSFQPNNNFPTANSYVPSQADINAGFVTITLTSANPNGPCGPVSSSFTLSFKKSEPLACNNLVQISLDEDGVVEILPDMILEGTFDDDFFSVQLFIGINAIGNQANCSHIGQTLMVEVTDICFGNKCWGSIVVEDKLAPVITCSDVEIHCTIDYNTVPPPVATDNCDPNPSVVLIDQFIPVTNICQNGLVIVQRTYLAVDQYGNESAPCVQTITIGRFLDPVFPADIEWECSVYEQFPNVVNPSPITFNNATTGSGIPGNIEGQYCNYGYTHADEILGACGNTFKIVRTWTLVDWCTGSVTTSLQIIKVLDTQGPTVVRPPFTVSANIPGQHPQPCRSQAFLPPATVSDNCNTWTIRIFTPIGEANYVNGVNGSQGGFIPAPGLGIGTHTILYTAEDACNNVTELYVTIEVVDDIVPTAICLEFTDVNLSSDGIAIVPASVFDNGTFDNCCLEGFEVRRMNGDCNGNFDPFGPTVTFCCSDVGSQVMVVFRAKDCFGNFNDCMVQVEVNDKLPPVLLSCPAPVSINCDNYLQNLAAGLALGDNSVLDIYGAASFYDNCDLNINYNVVVNINTCVQGSIVRTWQATDAAGNSSQVCTQTITVTHLNFWEIQFPADITAQCVNGTLPDFGEPTVFFDECELIGVSYEDQVFTVVPDACYKIIRTWTAINWCIYSPTGNNSTSDDPLVGLRRYRSGPDGFVQYQQTIKVVDNDAPDFVVPTIDGCIVSTGCTKTLNLPYPVITDECSLDFQVNITGAFGTFNNIGLAGVNIPNVGPGEYVVTYSVTDNCGNTSYQTVNVVVEDCKKPTPYCVNGLVIEIMQTGMVDVWAADFDAGSFDNCGPVQLSFSPNVNNIELIFDCTQLGQNIVQLWVTDAAGNQDYCETFVLIQDNMNHCPGGNPVVVVSGLIATETSAPVANVMVDVNGGMQTLETNSSGTYSFTLPIGGDYTVTPMLDLNPLNGVTTFDLVLIQRHILGVQPLDSPYKMIAADANRSNTITTFDLLTIRRVILFIDDHFQNNTSWRFVPTSFVFPNPSNPWATTFPEVSNFNNLTQNEIANFVAVKIGDVNGSVVTNGEAGSENRTTWGTFSIQVEDQLLERGQVFTIPVLSAEQQQVLGWQFTLELNTDLVEVLGIESGLTGTEHVGLSRSKEGAVTTSWNQTDVYNLAADELLFGVVVRAHTRASLSEILGVSSRFTQAEAYGPNGELFEVNLRVPGAQAAGFALYQNVPNPFDGTTHIGFLLPEASFVRLSVLDVNGRVLKLIEGDYAGGYNEIRVSDLKATGVLYYRLEAGEHTAVRSMIRID